MGGRQLIRSDARIIATTNRNLKDWIEAGKFREDLSYRVSVVKLCIPPLREQREDIPILADYLLQQTALKIGRETPTISKIALMTLMDYHFPGNVRELENILTRAFLSCRGSIIQASDLEFLTTNSNNGHHRQATVHAPLREIERDHIVHVLEMTNWHRGRACEVLGISRPTLRKKLRRYELMNVRQEFTLQSADDRNHHGNVIGRASR